MSDRETLGFINKYLVSALYEAYGMESIGGEALALYIEEAHKETKRLLQSTDI